jgi:hypothetical protein
MRLMRSVALGRQSPAGTSMVIRWPLGAQIRQAGKV